MGIIFNPSVGLLEFFQVVETILFLTLVLVQTPVILVLLYCCVCQLRLFKSADNDSDASYYSKRVNNNVFHLTCSLYQFLHYDDSFEVPRLVIFGFIAPIYYTYHLLVFGIVFFVSCLYQFWESLFISSQSTVPCDTDDTATCVSIDIKVRDTFNIILTTVAAIIIVYTAALKFLLKCTEGKHKLNCLNKGSKVKYSRLKLYFAITVQLLVVFVVKPVFTIYFILVYFHILPIDSIFDHEGWFTTALFIDVIFYAMLTPWFLFVKESRTSTTTTEGFEPVSTKEDEEKEETTN